MGLADGGFVCPGICRVPEAVESMAESRREHRDFMAIYGWMREKLLLGAGLSHNLHVTISITQPLSALGPAYIWTESG